MGFGSGRRGPDPSATHGSRARYRGCATVDPCRCVACVKANSDYLKEYRRRQTNVRYTEGQNEVVPALRKQPGTVADPSREGARNG